MIFRFCKKKNYKAYILLLFYHLKSLNLCGEFAISSQNSTFFGFGHVLCCKQGLRLLIRVKTVCIKDGNFYETFPFR